MKINLSDKTFSVDTPYNAMFVQEAKNLGGKWVDSQWQFDIRELQRVKDAMFCIYGADTEREDLCTMRVEWMEDTHAAQSAIMRHGRTIAKATGRDSGARLGEGILLLKGGFTSEGSVKNWTTKANAGTVVLIRDFPRQAMEAYLQADKEKVEKGETLRSIHSLHEEDNRINSLKEEKERIEKRLGEINEILLAHQETKAKIIG